MVFAGTIIAVGLALISAAISRLDLFETLGADTFAVVAGFALVLLGAFAIATYGVIRAIEWVCEELPLHSSREHSKPPICLPKRMEGRMAFSVTATEVGAKARLRLL